MELSKNVVMAVLSLALAAPVLATATVTPAKHPVARREWHKTHPVRTHDNRRMREQMKRINADLKAGRITQAQADQLKANVKTAAQQEKADIQANGTTHLTADQAKALDQQLDANGKAIYQDAHPSAPAPVPAQ